MREQKDPYSTGRLCLAFLQEAQSSLPPLPSTLCTIPAGFVPAAPRSPLSFTCLMSGPTSSGECVLVLPSLGFSSAFAVLTALLLRLLSSWGLTLSLSLILLWFLLGLLTCLLFCLPLYPAVLPLALSPPPARFLGTVSFTGSTSQPEPLPRTPVPMFISG